MDDVDFDRSSKCDKTVNTPVYAVNFDSISAARERIKEYINMTPIITSETLNLMCNKKLFFKCELFQKTGSFKARGACNAVLKQPGNIFVTHSSGNHAQALAWAGGRHGSTVYVVMPSDASRAKQKAVIDYGAILSFCEPTLRARESAAQLIVESTGAKLIHSYNDPDIISGQGTVGLEILEQVPYLEAIIIPIGGGGLISGITIAAKSINPNIIIIAAEPASADDAFKSKQVGSIVIHEKLPDTIADGLRTNLGSNTWPVIRDLVDRVILVSEDEIRSALRLVLERMKCVIEPSAAVGVAVALGEEFRILYPTLQNVGIVLCGGNIDLDNFAALTI